MTGIIDFSVWSPDEATFWASWEAAGIIAYGDNSGERYFTAEYQGIEVTTSWPGFVIATPATDETPATYVTGWHCNVRVTGPLVAEFTYSLPQTDEHGELLDVMQRTWAAHLFGLTQQDANPVTGFPAGWRSAAGITYTDTRNISTPENVWL